MPEIAVLVLIFLIFIGKNITYIMGCYNTIIYLLRLFKVVK